MKLLNLGCGGARPQSDEWINLDDLHSQLAIGEASRTNLDTETNYMNFVVGDAPLPFEDGYFDGVIASHFFEHFPAKAGLSIMEDCRRVLKPGGILLVSVPDASYFRRIHGEDRKENWHRLFGEGSMQCPIDTFFEVALWFEQHEQIFTEDALWAYFRRARFEDDRISAPIGSEQENFSDLCENGAVLTELASILNRRKFSLIMFAVK